MNQSDNKQAPSLRMSFEHDERTGDLRFTSEPVQSENQSDRATPEDVAWLAEYFEDDEWSDAGNARIGRILNSLRAPAATEQQPAAWAVQYADGTIAVRLSREDAELSASSWHPDATAVPLYAAPPAPVVQQQPRAWECACGGVMPGRYNVCSECGEMVRADCAATPLYALKESP